MKDVPLDVDRFMKDLESAMRHHSADNDGSDLEAEEESSSGMDFDDSGDEDIEEDNEERDNPLKHSYSNALNRELKGTTLDRSFIHANDHALKKIEEISDATEDMDEDFTPVVVDVNLWKMYYIVTFILY